MADKILPKGTSIRFKGGHAGEYQPIGEIVTYESDTGYYQCAFHTIRWNPKLLRSEFKVIPPGKAR